MGYALNGIKLLFAGQNNIKIQGVIRMDYSTFLHWLGIVGGKFQYRDRICGRFYFPRLSHKSWTNKRYIGRRGINYIYNQQYYRNNYFSP